MLTGAFRATPCAPSGGLIDSCSGGGGGGAGEGSEQPSNTDGEPKSQTQAGAGFGIGFGGLMWPAGAFEISEGRVTWRPAIDVTRVLVMALMLAIAVVRARGRRS
jgi:hypothetical protein